MPRPTIDDLKFQNARGIARLLKEHRDRESAENGLKEFVMQAWSVVEPGVQFVPGWHIDAIVEHLEAVMRGQIRKLIINVPPGSTKSLLCAVFLPAWKWVDDPAFAWIFASYDLKLSMRDSLKCRTLIGSEWYQKRWNQKFKILTGKGGQDSKQRFNNDKGGYRAATAVDVGTTGFHADCIVYDDPNNVREMNSDAYIDSVVYFHEHVMASRLKNPNIGTRICIQQRSSERDLTGHILAHEQGWEHLIIPMEYEGSETYTSIGWSDPRTVVGELMCPSRVNSEETSTLKKTQILWAGQYQQRPAPGEGAKFKRHWWNFWNPSTVPVAEDALIRLKVPGGEDILKKPVPLPIAFEQVVQAWDMSFKALSDSDFVAGHAWGRVGANVYLIARDTQRRDFPDTVAAVRRMAREIPCPEKLVEDKANGPAVIQTLANEIPGLIPSEISGGLLSLATSMTGYAEAGNIYLPNPDLYPWVWEFIEQFAVFPNGKHDDDVSAASHAWRRLFDSISNAAAPEFRVLPRVGEPASACHVRSDVEIASELSPHLRRWIAVAPGKVGAALWFAEMPSGSIRVYRELELQGVDAHESGRRIAELSIPDIQAFLGALHSTAKWHIDVLLEKLAFAPVEPIGSYAELMEQGLLAWEPTGGTWEARESDQHAIKAAQFSCQMALVEDASWDRLRDLLRFQPLDFEELPWDRQKMFDLAYRDVKEYQRYMDAVEGKVTGEWPKIRFSDRCARTAAALGASRREVDVTDSFLRALLIGISAPPSVMTKQPPREMPWNPQMRQKRGGALQMAARRAAGLR